MRIRHWKFLIRENNEYIPKSYLNDCKSETSKVDELVQNITENGMTPATLQHLRIGVSNLHISEDEKWRKKS